MKRNQRKLSLLLALVILGATTLITIKPAPADAVTWTANWVWQSVDGPANTWIAFRKTFNLSSIPSTAIANIAAETKYWMWINGTMAVFEGGLKRGPTPNDSYYDEVDIKSYLQTGTNTIAILVWHFGKHGFSHKNSGKGGLLFQADLGGTVIKTDTTWKMKVHPAYESTTANPQPNYRLAEYNVRFNAQNDLAGWTQSGYNDSSWAAPVAKGVPPVAPWGNPWKRPIPQWKNSGLVSYTNEASLGLPKTISSTTTLVAKLPYNAQITPYLEVDASAGLVIDMRTDDYCGGGNGSDYNARGEYVTKSGIQTYESFGWMNGHEVQYKIPAGVTVRALKYRETGFNTNFTGSFSCNDSYYNTLWEKAKRTLYVTMRDNYMDCPDRERAQWWGDAVIELGETFYSLDRNSDLLTKKAISNLIEWQRANKTLYSPVPAGNWNSELPPQMLASVGKYGFWTYYWYTGDSAAIADAYPHVKDYLSVWTLDANGLVNHRAGEWDWEDWGSNIDQRVLDNCLYYLALQAAKDMANLTGNTGDVAGYDSKMTSLRNNFNPVLWNGTEYRSPGYSGDTDDRANAMAVVAGFADRPKWPAVRTVLLNHKNASPYMEKYVLEALYMMGYEQDALNRMKASDRYYNEVNDSTCTTLWEFWTKGGWGSYNHAWAGGPLTLLSQYGAGVAPETAGFGTYHVFPQVGNLTSINTVVPSIKGNITVGLASSSSRFDLNLTSPTNTTAIAGIPKNAFVQYGNKAINYITVGSTTVWSNGSYTGGVSGISWNGEDDRNLKFNAAPGTYAFKAYPSSATCTPTPAPATPTPTPTATPTPTTGTNLALNKTVTARVSLENADWGKQKLVDGTQTSIAGSKGYTSDPPQTTQSANEWVEVDLGVNVAFNQVKLFPRTDVDTSGGETPNFPVDFTIQIKVSGGSSYTTVKTVTNQPNPGHNFQSYDLGSQNARYVKVNVTKLGLPAYDEGQSNYYRLQLAEMGVYNIGGATPTPTPTPTATPTPTPGSTATSTPSQYDYVDAGESTSESAHNLQKDSRSGTSTEAGYTRRYSNYQASGSWFSYDVSVPAGVNTIKLEIRETCDGARLKDYNIYLDGVLLEHYSYTTSGAGAYIYTRTPTGLSSRTGDGKLTIKFEEENPWQNYDPSIADIWVKSN